MPTFNGDTVSRQDESARTTAVAAAAVTLRKNLDPDFAAEFVEKVKAEAKERQKAAGGDKRSAKAKENGSLVPTRGQAKARKSSTIIAKNSGTSPTTVAKTDKILAEHPELADDIVSGAKSATQVERELKESGREHQRHENAKKVADAPRPSEIAGVYSTIVIDPPWDWGDRSRYQCNSTPACGP